MPAGSLVGALASGFLGDKVGRKYAIQIGGLIWIIGAMCVSIFFFFSDLGE